MTKKARKATFDLPASFAWMARALIPATSPAELCSSSSPERSPDLSAHDLARATSPRARGGIESMGYSTGERGQVSVRLQRA